MKLRISLRFEIKQNVVTNITETQDLPYTMVQWAALPDDVRRQTIESYTWAILRKYVTREVQIYDEKDQQLGSVGTAGGS